MSSGFGRAAKAINVFLKENSHWMSVTGLSWTLVQVTGYDGQLKKALRLSKDGITKDHHISDDEHDHIGGGGKATVNFGCGKSVTIN